ncbi:MAG: hypothetical protein Q9208_004632 [Pyrenodesmia sp. 3 TL-2023]
MAYSVGDDRRNVIRQQTIGFLSLPAEVRNKIYQLAVIHNTGLDLWPDRYLIEYRALRRNCPRRHYSHICEVTPWCTGPREWELEEGVERVELDCPHHYARKYVEQHGVDQPPCWIDGKWKADFQGAPYVNRYGWSKLYNASRTPRVSLQSTYKGECNWSHPEGPSLTLNDHCRLRPIVDAQRLFVRDQRDLQLIRKHLAPGLLTTCSQVRLEAMPFFWGGNIFTFTGNGGWQGLLRFLLTIGPDARRFIKELQVSVPIGVEYWSGHNHNAKNHAYLDGRSKNHPKLHMVKIPNQDELSAVRQVVDIMLQDNAVRKLILSTPYRSYCGSVPQVIQSNGWNGLLQTQRILQRLALTEIRLQLEEGALLAIRDVYRRIDSLEWNLYCTSGSYVDARSYSHSIWQYHTPGERTHKKYSYLEGVPSLFGAVDEDLDVGDVAAKKALRGTGSWVNSSNVLRALTVYPVIYEDDIFS